MNGRNHQPLSPWLNEKIQVVGNWKISQSKQTDNHWQQNDCQMQTNHRWRSPIDFYYQLTQNRVFAIETKKTAQRWWSCSIFEIGAVTTCNFARKHSKILKTTSSQARPSCSLAGPAVAVHNLRGLLNQASRPRHANAIPFTRFLDVQICTYRRTSFNHIEKRCDRFEIIGLFKLDDGYMIHVFNPKLLENCVARLSKTTGGRWWNEITSI